MPKHKHWSVASAEAGAGGILNRIVASKRREVAEIAPRAAELRARAVDVEPARPFAAALRHPTEVRLLAEIKRRSPSAGSIRPGADPVDVARAYAAGGAAALSVLTDGPFFGGDLEALRAVRGAVELPVLRKDFMIDPVQLWEARAAGADAVLLIVRILEQSLLEELLGLAAELGMNALVEIHDRSELERARIAGAMLIGVNNRDLDSFRTDLALSLELTRDVPPGVTLVAESGIRSAEHVRRLGEAGVDAVLVGESLMRQEDLQAAAAALVGRPKREDAR
ncbi:MAG TPA: indole-3-glycerol phosphate synthase TrpC [Longimicrobiaceae bacterium]|nr:indole-3-glycerol phosphate synthase TrpC [Longimicrobiaceae bacterium]